MSPAPGPPNRPGSAGGARSGPPAQADDGRPARALLSRDDLTKAWGDTVLPALRPAVKVYLAPGRFVSVEEGAAVFALPDHGLLRRAEPVRREAEEALAAHFGRPVRLRLVLDDGAIPVREEGPPPDSEDPGDYVLEDLQDAGPGVVSPEQRLLEAFPGAEEVTP